MLSKGGSTQQSAAHVLLSGGEEGNKSVGLSASGSEGDTIVKTNTAQTQETQGKRIIFFNCFFFEIYFFLIFFLNFFLNFIFLKFQITKHV